MDYSKLSPPELANLSKMSGDDLKFIEVTKMWLMAVTTIIVAITLSLGINSAIDRVETGHAVTTTTTVTRQLVNRTNESQKTPEPIMVP